MDDSQTAAAYNLPVLLAGAAACAGGGVQTARSLVDARRRVVRRRRAIADGREAFRTRVQAVAAEARARAGSQLAWQGLRELRVSAIEDECRGVKSFYLASADGRPLPPYHPGQFLTVHLPGPPGGKPVVRCYTLSDRPREEYYRISVKHCPPPASEPGAPPGVGSTILHRAVKVGDRLRAAAPRGDFFLRPEGEGPVVLIGAGIGVTPLLSMLAAQAHAGLVRETYLVLGMRSGGEHPFDRATARLAAEQPSVRRLVAYSRPAAGDLLGQDYEHRGRLDIDYLRQALPTRDASFFLCGPPGLMESLVPGLLAWGVPDNQIHFEAFGPASVNQGGAAAAA
ncbi:MAG: FAD-binding oxidoreductase, partial [Planctomycetota bacterium]